MIGVYRITSKAMAMLFRLVMILSLAGYSFSAVNAAMHADNSPRLSQMENDHSSHNGNDHSVMIQTDHEDDYGSPERTKNSCCKDYCGVAAITCTGWSLSHPRVVLVHEFADDTNAIGEAPSLHRPPNI